MKTELLLMLVLVVTLILGSCSSDRISSEGRTGCIKPADGDELLTALAEYYEDEDLECFTALLCEDFEFCFTSDVADSLGLPPESPCWGKMDDTTSTGRMFRDPVVVDIKMDYVRVTDWEPCFEERPESTYTGLCCRIDPEIRVTVTRPQEETLTLWVNSSWLDVTVIPCPGADSWCLLELEEREKMRLGMPGAIRAAATEASTWGGIKALWHKP
jgi:hypothetical protein